MRKKASEPETVRTVERCLACKADRSERAAKSLFLPGAPRDLWDTWDLCDQLRPIRLMCPIGPIRSKPQRLPSAENRLYSRLFTYIRG